MIHVAVSLAESNTSYPKWRLGAALVKGGSLIATGVSKLHTSPKLVKGGINCSEHAEMAALRRARNSNLSGATIYVARVGRDGDIKLARPCKSCQKALRKAGIKKVVYTTENGIKRERIIE